MSARKRRSYKDASLSQFRSFCEVCRRGGYAAAARELMLTSPAVWEQMQALEYHYGMKLLERAGPGVRPTVHGRRLLELIRPLVAGIDSTREVLQQEDGAFPRQLVLVTNLRVLVEEISGAMRAFQRRYPAIRLAVHYTGSDEVEPRVLEGKADVALTLEPEPTDPSSAETVYEPAAKLDYLLITPRRHDLGHGGGPPPARDRQASPRLGGARGVFSPQSAGSLPPLRPGERIEHRRRDEQR